LDKSDGCMGGKTALITGGTAGIGKATNHLAPFLLTNLLLEPFEKSTPSRVIKIDEVSGKYFSDRKEIEAKKVAYDRAARRRLWEISEELSGLKVAV
jgi:hypothetical protein